MYQILCVEHGTGHSLVIATGFCDRAEAHQTARDWINRRFPQSTYDYGPGSWWLLDHCRTYHVVVGEVPELVVQIA